MAKGISGLIEDQTCEMKWDFGSVSACFCAFACKSIFRKTCMHKNTRRRFQNPVSSHGLIDAGHENDLAAAKPFQKQKRTKTENLQNNLQQTYSYYSYHYDYYYYYYSYYYCCCCSSSY